MLVLKGKPVDAIENRKDNFGVWESFVWHLLKPKSQLIEPILVNERAADLRPLQSYVDGLQKLQSFERWLLILV